MLLIIKLNITYYSIALIIIFIERSAIIINKLTAFWLDWIVRKLWLLNFEMTCSFPCALSFKSNPLEKKNKITEMPYLVGIFYERKKKEYA